MFVCMWKCVCLSGCLNGLDLPPHTLIKDNTNIPHTQTGEEGEEQQGGRDRGGQEGEEGTSTTTMTTPSHIPPLPSCAHIHIHTNTPFPPYCTNPQPPPPNPPKTATTTGEEALLQVRVRRLGHRHPRGLHHRRCRPRRVADGLRGGTGGGGGAGIIKGV